MKVYFLRSFKKALTHIGARTPARRLHLLQMIINYMKLGRWMTDNHFHIKQRSTNRLAVFEAVAQRVCEARVLYLEFGVYKGASMRYWSSALKHPAAKLHGFDSFEGLPEDFDGIGGHHKKGMFNVGGVLPNMDDPRVEFFKGWFTDVLPGYSLPDHDTLVVVMDADLYSSTSYVLNRLCPHVVPGSFIYFDNMSRPEHEARAFREFIEKSGLRFELVAADDSLNTAFFECVGRTVNRGCAPLEVDRS